MLRRLSVGAVATFFLIPLVAMADFSTRTLAGSRTGKAWITLFDLNSLASQYRPLWDGLKMSLLLVPLTVNCIVP